MALHRANASGHGIVEGRVGVPCSVDWLYELRDG